MQEWGEEEERLLRVSLAKRASYVGVLLRYGYSRDDILQEMRLACLTALRQHGNRWKRSTLIDRAVHYKLMHLVRYEGKRARLYE